VVPWLRPRRWKRMHAASRARTSQRRAKSASAWPRRPRPPASRRSFSTVAASCSTVASRRWPRRHAKRDWSS
ncbi:hypothetical protein LTR94_036169, partial [Friedmanniomyces endolithicus]